MHFNQIHKTLAAILLGLCFGLLLKSFCPAEINLWLQTDIFNSIRDMFMHALSMIVPPMIFFSVMTGITSMDNSTDLGRISGKFFAISMAKLLQVLFMACFFGVIINKSGDRAYYVKNLISFLNDFCLDVVNVVVKFIPPVIFFSMSNMIIDLGLDIVISLGKIILGGAIGVIVIIIVDGLLIGLFVSSLLTFWRKILPFPPIFDVIGVPLSAVSIVICIFSIIGMFATVGNVAADIPSTFLLAKAEKKFDAKIFSTN